MDRAIAFYNSVFGFDLKVNLIGDLQMSFFPNQNGQPGASGALVKHEAHYMPGIMGPVVYFTCTNCEETLNKVLQAKGTIIQAKKQISEHGGFMGLFVDSEGNRVALHSMA